MRTHTHTLDKFNTHHLMICRPGFTHACAITITPLTIMFTFEIEWSIGGLTSTTNFNRQPNDNQPNNQIKYMHARLRDRSRALIIQNYYLVGWLVLYFDLLQQHHTNNNTLTTINNKQNPASICNLYSIYTLKCMCMSCVLPYLFYHVKERMNEEKRKKKNNNNKRNKNNK